MGRNRIIFTALLCLALMFLSSVAFAQAAATPAAQDTASAPAASAQSTHAPAQAPAQASDQPPPPPAMPGGATHVMGFEDSKRNTKGKLTVADGKLKFEKNAIDISSISDVFTGSESKQVGGTPLTLVKIAAPFGAGRALSLVAHQQIDNITIEYSDANGGLHGAIFTMPKGQGEQMKKQLVAAGAHASIAVTEASAKTDAPKEKK